MYAPRLRQSLLSRNTIALASRHQVRRLCLHEYQSQDMLKQYNVPVPRGVVIQTAQEARAAAAKLGKAEFVPFVRSYWAPIAPRLPASEIAEKLFGSNPENAEPDQSSVAVKEVYLTEPYHGLDKWRLIMTIDRENHTPVVALERNSSSPLHKGIFPFSISQGPGQDILDKLSTRLDASPEETRSLETILTGMYKIFVEKDALSLEVNALVRGNEGSFKCMESNFTFDDAVAKRQKELFALRDTKHEIRAEIESEKYGLVYVKMDGDIGNIVNGAGLAMATNDAISYHGGKSANFLDGGGQATKETMIKAFDIVLKDERVKTILVNVYGGITDGRMIAESIIGAAAELGPLRVPVVVRLQGTNSAEGLKLLDEADLGLYVEADFGAAAEKAVELANKSDA